jgi:type I restriction enzyme R subunit
MAKELFSVAHWFGRQYTRGDPNAIPDQFDEAALPPPPQDIARHTRAQLKTLADGFWAKDKELREARETVDALKAELAALRKQVSVTKVVNEAIPDAYDYNYTEVETRRLLIDVLLREAGWDPEGKNVAEYRVEPMPNRQGFGFADYVLWGADDLPLAVVEAKKTKISKERGKQQAVLYANALEQMHGRRPIIFYSNGYTISLWDDYFYPPREVQGFYTQDELERLIQRRQTAQNLSDMAINKATTDRYYQEAAIRQVTAHFEERHRRALLVMATGTGKTRVAVALADVLMRANWAKRILFLADRIVLVRQAVKTFKTHLPASNPINLLEDKDAAANRVVVSTGV